MSANEHEGWFSFWHWLFKGYNSNPGLDKWLNHWFLLEVVTAIFLAAISSKDVRGISETLLLPVAGILIGAIIGSLGTAVSLAQSKEIQKLSEFSDLEYPEYIYPTILPVLSGLSCVVFFIIGAAVTFQTILGCFIFLSIGYLLLASSLRLCWGLSVGTCWLAIAIYCSRNAEERKD